MNDLFQKLNLLIRSGLRELVGDPPNLESLRRRLVSGGLGPDLDNEVNALRQRVNDAIAYEDTLLARVHELQAQADTLSSQADDAVAAGMQDKARELLAQLQRVQQRLSIAEADLREHRSVTQDLIQRVNMLESVVAEAKAERQAKTDAGASTQSGGLTEVLRSAREQLDRDMSAQAPSFPATDEGKAVPKPGEEDFERRRQRLTKPSSEKPDKS